MKLGTNGLVLDEFGQILMILRDDSRTWAPPGGGVEAGELPTDGVVREVAEETGIKTVPVRLVSMVFRTESKGDNLIFVFRCLKRGGTIETSEESPQVGYIPATDLPANVMGIHRDIIAKGYAHQGGAPILIEKNIPWVQRRLRDALYRYRDMQRRRSGQPPHQPSFDWQVGAFVVLQNEAGEILWAQRRDNGRWNLPGGGVEKRESPWQAAIREAKEETGLAIEIERVTGVYTKADIGEVVFNFAGKIVDGELTETAESQAFQWLPAGTTPDNSLVNHIDRVQDMLDSPDLTVFKHQTSNKLKRD